MRKRIFAIMMSAMMLITFMPTATFAATAPTPAPDVPTDWDSSIEDIMEIDNDGVSDNASNVNPYGKPVGQPFMLAEQTELFKFVNNNDNGKNPIFDAAIYDNMKAGNTHTGKVTDLFDKKTGVVVPNNTSIRNLNFTKAVSFDPTGCGRDDHIAVVGIDKDKCTWLYVYSTYTKNWSEGIKLEDFWWVQDGTKHPTEFYEMTNYISITAGDYDGDYKDSLVVFLASENKASGNIDSYGLTEVKCKEDNSNNITLSYDSKNQQDLLNPSYVENYKKIREPYKDYGWGYVRLKGVVATGDFNGDTIDDLAVLSYSEAWSFNGNINTFVPYLGVSYGEKGTTAITNTLGDGEYVRDNATSPYVTMTDAGMTVVDTDDEGADDIVVAGRYAEWKFDKNFNYTGNKYTDDVNIAKYGFNKNKLVKRYIKKNGTDGNGNVINFKLNGWSGNYGKDWPDRPQISVQGAYMNGPLNPAYVEIGGDIYDLSAENVVKRIYSYNYLKDDRGHMNFIPNVAVGNFDGNEYGYEQFVFTLGERADNDTYYMSFGMVGIDNSKRDEKTDMVPADQLNGAFYETSASNCDDTKHSCEIYNYKAWSWAYQMSCLVVPVDSDNDGTLARYSQMTINYTDPKPVAILEAAPYFGELRANSGCYGNDAYGVGSTSLKYVDTVGKGEGINAGTTVEEGKDRSIGILRRSGTKSAAEAEKKNGSFSATYKHSNSVQFDANGTNQVIVARIPLYFYSYDIFKADPNHPEKRDSWYENAYSVSTTHAAKFASIEQSQYNLFVEKYNDYMEQVVAEYNYYVDEYNKGKDPNQETAEKMNLEDVLMTKLDTEQSGLGTAGDPKSYQKTNGEMERIDLNDVVESEVTMPHGMGSHSISTSDELETSKIRGTSSGMSINYSKTKGRNYKHGGKNFHGSYQNGSADLGTSYSAENAKRIDFGITLAGITPCTGYSAADLAQYSLSCRLAQWKSNIPTGGSLDDGASFIHVPVFGSHITQLKQPVKTPDTLTVTREDLQGEAPQKMTINWQSQALADGQKYGIYLYGANDYELIATTKSKSYTYEPAKELPVYQFRVGILDKNDKLVSLSSHPVYAFAQRYFTELESMDIKPEHVDLTGQRASNDFIIEVHKVGGTTITHANESITNIFAAAVNTCGVNFNNGTTSGDSTVLVNFVPGMSQKIDLLNTKCDRNNDLSDKYEFALKTGEKCYILVPNIKNDSTGCRHEYVLKNFVTPSDVDGYTGDWVCSKCGDVKKGEKVTKLFTAKLSSTSLTYNGQEQHPNVVVTNANGDSFQGGYDVTWALGCKNVGTYAANLKIKCGRFEFDRTKEFKIVPRGSSVKKLKSAKKAFTVKWAKQSAKMSISRITGYQIQRATNSKFTKSVKTVTVKGYKNTSKKIKKLKAKKTYYVRVRTYLKTGGKTYYSKWSKAKKVKTKK